MRPRHSQSWPRYASSRPLEADRIAQGMFHEVHNEFDPTPGQLATLITEWVHAHLGTTSGAAPGVVSETTGVGQGETSIGHREGTESVQPVTAMSSSKL